MSLRILLAGTPDFSAQIFSNLAQNSQNLGIEIIGLLTQADKPFGRKQELKPPATKAFFATHLPHLPIFQNLDSQTLCAIRALKPDLILVVAFGRILNCEFLNIAPCVNIHASILPTLRGASPLQEMILHNHKFFGVSLMKMEAGLDSGAILGIRFCENTGQDIFELNAQAAQMGYELSAQFFEKLKTKSFENLASLNQAHCDATYCKKIKKENGCVDFDNAQVVWQKFLAYKFWPGIFLPNGLKITQILNFSNNVDSDKGRILQVHKDFVKVACNIGTLDIASVQAPGKKEVSAHDYLLGKRLKVGDFFCARLLKR